MKTLEQDEEEMKDLVRKSHDHAMMTAAQRKEAKLLEESMVKYQSDQSLCCPHEETLGP